LLINHTNLYLMKKMTFLCACIAGLSYTADAQAPFTDMFCPVDTTWAGKTIVVPPSPLRYDVLLQENDIAHNLDKGSNAPLKGGFGSVYYEGTSAGAFTTVGTMKITPSTGGWLYLSLSDNKSGSTGDGGGLVRMKVKSVSGHWEVEPQTEAATTYKHRFFDLDAQGGTYQTNGIHWGVSGGSTSGSGNLFMYDGWANNNAALSGITDVSDYTLPAGSPAPGLSIPRYQNMGWLSEASKSTGKPLRKLYGAGRGDFGGILVSSKIFGSSPTSKSIIAIYATQTQPSVLLKYEGDQEKIYAFQQNAGSYKGKWILLNDVDVDGSVFPFAFADLLDVQKLALERGATMFNRLGGIVGTATDFFIAETGGNADGDAYTNPVTAYTGTLAHHLKLKDGDNNGRFSDPYGRILRFTTSVTDLEIKPYLEGGRTLDGRYIFSNPKQLAVSSFTYNVGTVSNNAGFLIINEAVPDKDFKRNPATAVNPEDLMQEIYFLNLTTANPKLSDLRPFAILPRGAEIQSAFSIGSRWSPLFMSIRYPNTANDSPYDRSVLMAVSNFEEYFANPTGCSWVSPPAGGDTTTAIRNVSYQAADDFEVWPNPAQRSLHFNQAYDLELYDVSGKLIKTGQDTKELNIFDLSPGMYFIRNEKGQTKKVMIQ
jgi:hypothetical protein